MNLLVMMQFPFETAQENGSGTIAKWPEECLLLVPDPFSRASYFKSAQGN